MAIAKTTEFWTSRLVGDDPANPTQGQDNDAWTEVGTPGGGAASSGYWVIDTNQEWKITPTSSDYTMVASINFSDAASLPSSGTVLMRLDNGTYRVEVRSKGTNAKLDLVGTTTQTTRDLDLDKGEDDSVDVILRLTLTSAGVARLYMREIIEDDDAATDYLQVTGASGSGKEASWGNTSGEVSWGAVYYTHKGAFSPDELSTSDWTTDTLLRLGLSLVNQLKDSPRIYLKSHVDDSSIVYGFDLSSSMVSRIRLPSIHIVVQELTVPEMLTLGASRAEHEYEVVCYVTTRGTNYANAYRLGMDIAGEVFDEVFTNTGLSGTQDSLVAYTAQLDSKLDDDEVICVHVLRFRYMRRINLLHR